MEALDPQKKSLVLVKKIQNFVCVCIIMLTIVICLLMEKKPLHLKSTIKMLTLPTQFCLESISNGFSNTESKEISLNGNVYDFSVDGNFIDKSDILNIHKYLMNKNKIK